MKFDWTKWKQIERQTPSAGAERAAPPHKQPPIPINFIKLIGELVGLFELLRRPCSSAINENIFQLIAGVNCGEREEMKPNQPNHSLKRMMVDGFHFSFLHLSLIHWFLFFVELKRKKAWLVCWGSAAHNPLLQQNNPTQPSKFIQEALQLLWK